MRNYLGESIMEGLGAGPILRLDDHLAGGIDITPFLPYLDRSQPLGETIGQIKLWIDQRLSGPVDESVFLAKQPP